MIERRRIFIGSSTEALKMASAIGALVEGAGMEPVLWEKEFPAGDMLLTMIEELPNLVQGAVLLATKDLECLRIERKEKFFAPVQNVMFEYGYLSGRLSRKRVAICQFRGAELPSDLQGVTVIPSDLDHKVDPPHLPEGTAKSLQRWLESLPVLAAGVTPLRQVHGYSGMWRVQNRFSRWHGIDLGSGDTAHWNGETFLHLPGDGREGFGTQIGQLKVKIQRHGYEATWNVSNEVVKAEVEDDGSLRMRVRVVARHLAEPEIGRLPDDTVGKSLDVREWDVHLKPAPEASETTMKGEHVYKVAGEIYSKAEEWYTQD